MIILSGHPRVGYAAFAIIGLWCLIRGLRFRWILVVFALGLACSLPGALPMLFEWREASENTSRFVALLGPAHPALDIWNLPGLLAPRTDAYHLDHGIGAVLLIGGILGFSEWTPQVKKLGMLWLVLVAAVALQHVPLMRFLFAPLLLQTHPVNEPYFSMSLIPLAVMGGAGLDWLLRSGRLHWRARLRGIPGFLLGLMILGMALQAVMGPFVFESTRSWALYALGVGQAAAVLLALVWLLRRTSIQRSRLTTAVFLLALLDLLACGIRLHTATPSRSLDLRARGEYSELDELSEGSLDILALKDLEPFVYDVSDSLDEDMQSESGDPEPSLLGEVWFVLAGSLGVGGERIERDVWEECVAAVQAQVLERSPPALVGMQHGFRAFPGPSKFPPRRSYALLSPLAQALGEQGCDAESLREYFGSPETLGSRVMVIEGLTTAIGCHGDRRVIHDPAPRCYSPTSFEVVHDEAERVHALLETPFEPGGLALLEHPLLFDGELGQARVQCDEGGFIESNSSREAVVVLRERFHPGWRVRLHEGERLHVFPVNQEHIGFMVPPGGHTVLYRFVPPGLVLSLLIAIPSWLLVGVLWWAGRARAR